MNDDRLNYFRFHNKQWSEISKRDRQAFSHTILASTQLTNDVFLNDDMLCWFRSFSFLDDPELRSAIGDSEILRARWWRVHVLCWAANTAMLIDREADHVDIGCYDGKTVETMMKYCGFADSGVWNSETKRFHGKTWWCYDIFDEPPEESRKTWHGPALEAIVRARLGERARVIRSDGSTCPEMPENISFCQTDVNSAEAEETWLAHVYPRLVPGAIVVHDDYGWTRYAESKRVIDEFLRKRGHRVLELPTGQGMWIR